MQFTEAQAAAIEAHTQKKLAEFEDSLGTAIKKMVDAAKLDMTQIQSALAQSEQLHVATVQKQEEQDQRTSRSVELINDLEARAHKAMTEQSQNLDARMQEQKTRLDNSEAVIVELVQRATAAGDASKTLVDDLERRTAEHMQQEKTEGEKRRMELAEELQKVFAGIQDR